MTTPKTDRAAHAQALIRRAIAHFQAADAHAQALIRRDPSLGDVGRPDEISVAQRTARGMLRCHVSDGQVTMDGEQLFDFYFTLDGDEISHIAAEAVLAGRVVETARPDAEAGELA